MTKQKIFPEGYDPTAKRSRGRPTKEEMEARKQWEAEQQKLADEKAVADMSDEEFFEKKSTEIVSAKRKRLLELSDDLLSEIFRLGRLACTHEEAAAFLRCSKKTFQNFLNEFQEAKDAWDDGFANAKISLRRKQFQLADKNAPMAIFLGKNMLGQKDISESVVTHNKPANELNDADLEKIAMGALGDGKAKSESKKVH